NLTERLQQAHVAGKFRRTRCNTGHRAEHRSVELTRVRLSADGNGGGEAHSGRDEPVQLAHFRVVAVEEPQERRLSAGGALDAAQRQRVDPILHVADVEYEILDP